MRKARKMEKKKSKKKYWKYLVTIAIFALMVLAYYLISSSEASNSYLFPAGSKIWQAFVQDKSVFGTNALHSFKLLIPSLFLAIVLSLAIGIPLGLNETARQHRMKSGQMSVNVIEKHGIPRKDLQSIPDVICHMELRKRI